MNNAEKFLERIKTDKELQHQLKVAEENYTGDRRDGRAAAEAVILPIAAKAGLPFTIDELEAAVRKLTSDGAELSEKELAAVSGGTLGCFLYGSDDDSEEICVLVSMGEGNCLFFGD